MVRRHWTPPAFRKESHARRRCRIACQGKDDQQGISGPITTGSVASSLACPRPCRPKDGRFGRPPSTISDEVGGEPRQERLESKALSSEKVADALKTTMRFILATDPDREGEDGFPGT